MSYAFSPANNAFYPISLQATYEEAGTWPEDAHIVDESIFLEFSETPPEGMFRSVGSDGLPVWMEIPGAEETVEQRQARARTLRDNFISCTDKLLIDDYTINNVALDDQQREELKDVRASFKCWPQLEGWPEIEPPEIPQWLLIEAANNGYVVYNWPE